jgi:methyl-CpG-binding domain protein 4
MTRGKAVKNVIDKFFQKFPDPNVLLNASDEEIGNIIKPLGRNVSYIQAYSLGLWDKRTQGIRTFSKEFMETDWTYPSELHGIGKYAEDCYRIFCCRETTDVKPQDHALRKYLMWRQNPLMETEDIKDIVDTDVKRSKKKVNNIT